MAPKRSKHLQQLNVDQYTLLKKPMEHLGKQLNVPGSFWQGRMSEDERDKIYKCTIVDFSLAQKVAPTSSPRMAFKVQEMGIDGTGSHEHSDLASTMYWIGYPMPFLRFFYDTFPAVDGASAGAAVVVEPERAGGNGVNDSASDGGASSDVHPKFPSLRMPSTVIYKYFTVISDKLGLSSTARLPLYIGVARGTSTKFRPEPHASDRYPGCPGIRETPTSRFKIPSTRVNSSR